MASEEKNALNFNAAPPPYDSSGLYPSANEAGRSSPIPPPMNPNAPGVAPLQGGQTNQPVTVIIGPTLTFFGPYPTGVTCPNCQQPIVTAVQYRSGVLTWLICCLMILFGLFWGCCLIPFCIDRLKNAEHFCPHCHRLLGIYKPL